MRTLLPWLPAFLFGGALILVGKYLQSVEKKKPAQRELSTRLSVLSNLNTQASPSSFNRMGAYQRKEQEKQKESTYHN